jgi:hypothetical protein
MADGSMGHQTGLGMQSVALGECSQGRAVAVPSGERVNKSQGAEALQQVKIKCRVWASHGPAVQRPCSSNAAKVNR